MTKQEAQTKLAELVSAFKQERNRVRKEAMAIADEFGLVFCWDDTYGASEQTYYGKGSTRDGDDWQDSGCFEPDVRDEGEWKSSSDDC